MRIFIVCVLRVCIWTGRKRDFVKKMRQALMIASALGPVSSGGNSGRGAIPGAEVKNRFRKSIQSFHRVLQYWRNLDVLCIFAGPEERSLFFLRLTSTGRGLVQLCQLVRRHRDRVLMTMHLTVWLTLLEMMETLLAATSTTSGSGKTSQLSEHQLRVHSVVHTVPKRTDCRAHSSSLPFQLHLRCVAELTKHRVND